MTTSQQLKALLQSYVEDDRNQFLAISLQMAAAEARKGHTTIARELKALVDQARGNIRATEPVQLAQPRGDLADLLTLSYPQERLGDLVIHQSLLAQFDRILREQRQSALIKNHGLSPRRKLLLSGPPGTGKTLASRVFAGELGLPLFVVRMDSVVTKFMGETSGKLRQIFNAISNRRGVYLFDEFDSIGADRDRDNEVGEMRRVLNTFLQLVEHDHSDSLIVAATNHASILDTALFRRFDDVLFFERPDDQAVLELIKRRLGNYLPKRTKCSALVDAARGLSHSDISSACNDAVKDAIVQSHKAVSLEVLKESFDHRSRLHVGRKR